VTNIRYKYLN